MINYKFYFVFSFIFLLFFVNFSSSISIPLNNSNNINGLNSSFNNYLSSYISNKILNLSIFYKLNLNNNSYILIKLNNNVKTLIFVNTSHNKYLLITNNKTIHILFNSIFLKTNFINKTSLLKLNHQMNLFKNESNGSLYTGIYSCLYRIGLTNQNSSCTLNNYCGSCGSVPICHDSLEAYGGPNSPFGFGLINFSKEYNKLKANYSNYFSILSIINNSNFKQKLLLLNSTTNNISSISKTMPQNPIFPVNQSISALRSTCNYSLPILQQKWYCVGTPQFCPAITFNNTLITHIHQIISTTVAKTSISEITNNSILLAHKYSNIAIQKHNQTQFNNFINSIYYNYNSILVQSNQLLSKTNFTNLSNSLITLEVVFSNIKNNGVHQNISTTSKKFNKILHNVTQQYKIANTLYYSILNISNNNTIILLRDELNYKKIPYKLAYYASQQQKINLRLNNKINLNPNSANQLFDSLNSIKSNLSLIPLPSYYLLSFTKNSAMPFVKILLLSNIPINIKIQFASILIPIFFLIIGAIIIILIYILYLILKAKHKINVNQKVKRSWFILFIILILFVLIFAYISFILAHQANTFLPLNQFINQMNKSNSIAIAANTMILNTSQNNCINLLKNNIENKNKTFIFININSACNFISNTTCISNVLNKNIPLISINPNSLTFMSYKGLYGNILYVNNSTINSDCLINKLLIHIKNK